MATKIVPIRLIVVDNEIYGVIKGTLFLRSNRAHQSWSAEVAVTCDLAFKLKPGMHSVQIGTLVDACSGTANVKRIVASPNGSSMVLEGSGRLNGIKYPKAESWAVDIGHLLRTAPRVP